MSLISGRKQIRQQPLKGKRKQHPEHFLQVDCVRYLRENFPNYIIFSTNNECTRGKQYWKDAGMLPGLSDLVVVIPGDVLWIEMKSETGRQRADQKHFEDKVKGLGYKYYLCRSLDEFKQIITDNI